MTLRSMTAVCLAAAVLLGACTPAENASSSSEAGTVSQSTPASQESSSQESHVPGPEETLPPPQDYLQQVVQEHVRQIQRPGMTDYEKVKAAADYLMAWSYYQRPIALDVWRWRTAGETPLTYEETRGLYLLLFGFETCEGYTAALNLLLEEMGIETRYMTGMTYLARGGLGYHSWSQVKVDGVWYHLDCELEDGVSDGGQVQYRYFLKGDDTMSASHFWGQRLIDLGRLELGQVEAVQADYMGESCPQDYPTPAPSQIAVTPQPDTEELRARLEEELAAYEEQYGPLEYQPLDILPPVFVRFYFDGDEPPADANELLRDYRQIRLLIDPPGTEV